MKGLIDLYKTVNESMYCRVQDSIPNSDCIGLTKEQRTKQASQDNRSDANKAMYYQILAEIIEKEQLSNLDKDEQKMKIGSTQIIDMHDKIRSLDKARQSIND